MSESETPFDPLIETPRKVVDRTIETQESINRQGIDLTRNAVKPFAGAISSDGDAEEQLDDAFDQLDEQQSEFLDGIQDVADRTFQTSEDAVEWGYDLIDRQVGRIQRAEDSAEEFAGETVDAAGDVAGEAAGQAESAAGSTVDSAESAVGQAGAAAEDAVRQFGDELDEAADEFDSLDALDDTAVEGLVEDGVETLSDLADQQADRVAEATDATTEQAEEWIDAAVEHEGRSLGDLDGIGETYSDRLAGAGIRTVDQLARTSADEVADVAEVDEERASEWIQQAQDAA